MRGDGEQVDGRHAANILRPVSTVAITRKPSPLLERGERTHIGRDPIDFERALAEHDAYRAALAELGARVTRLEDADELPDGVFVEDTALVLNEVAVSMRPGAESRRGEVSGIVTELMRYREVITIGGPATIDGGDVVVDGKRILVGRSARTNPEGIEALASIARRFGYEVRGARMSGCLHLKSGCTALPDGRLLINRRWIDARDVADFDLVDVPAEEPWGGDVAFIGETIIAAAAFPKTI
jgi:dimethylargininase